MMVCDLLPISSADFTHNLSELDNAAWSTGTYTQGQLVTHNQHNWECVASTTMSEPGTNTDWLDLSVVNFLKAFDEKNSTQTQSNSAVVYTFDVNPTRVINVVSVQNIHATSMRIEVTDQSAGLVYDQMHSLIDYGVSDFYEYFFSPILTFDRFTDINLPAYLNTTIKVTLEPLDGVVKVGRIALSSQNEIGALKWGYGFGIDDYSTVDRDEFGDVSIIERDYSDSASLPVSISSNQAYKVKQLLTPLRAKACLWIGDIDRPETQLIGFYTGLDFVVDNLTYSNYLLNIEGTV